MDLEIVYIVQVLRNVVLVHMDSTQLLVLHINAQVVLIVEHNVLDYVLHKVFILMELNVLLVLKVQKQIVQHLVYKMVIIHQEMLQSVDVQHQMVLD